MCLVVNFETDVLFISLQSQIKRNVVTVIRWLTGGLNGAWLSNWASVKDAAMTQYQSVHTIAIQMFIEKHKNNNIE